MKNQIIFLSALFLFIVSCERAPQKRVYEEIIVPKSANIMSGQMEDPHAGLRSDPALKSNESVKWTVPEEWEELPGGGFRMASFKSKTAPESIDCSIAQLGGQGGGIKANIIRWMEQIQVAVPSDEKFEEFLNRQKHIKLEHGTTAIILDFTQLQPNVSDESSSMLAAIIEQPDSIIFIKMMGSKAAVKKQEKPFLALSQSIKFK